MLLLPLNSTLSVLCLELSIKECELQNYESGVDKAGRGRWAAMGEDDQDGALGCGFEEAGHRA